MSILSNVDIKQEIEVGNLKLHGMNKDTIRENGLDLSIDNTYLIENFDYKNEFINIHNQEKERFMKVHSENSLCILSHEFVLLSTKEIIELPNNIMGLCAIRSTIARSGLFCPMTIVDCGFHGALTIEVYNASSKNIILYPGDRFLHVVLSYTKNSCDKPYNGVYNNQKIVTPPKISIL